MAWLTGKVQIQEPDYRPKNITVGDPFAFKKDGKWFCNKTNQELKSIQGKLKKK